MIKIKPFLKWAGNKYRCLDNILSSFPTANRLIEPFTGSGAIFMNAHYPHYLLADDNKDLVDLFHYLKEEGPAFIDHCEHFFSAANNSPVKYYELREKFNQCVSPRQRAAMFLYLNRHGYNGLCRYNLKGKYNVPFGRYKKPYFPREEMLHFYEKSHNTVFLHSDFRQTFMKAKRGDLIYCDPPYAPLSQVSNFSSYTHKKFGEAEQIALADLAMNAVNQGITVVISNHDTDFTRHHYRNAEIKSFPVKRSISCHPEHRVAVQELVAIFS